MLTATIGLVILTDLIRQASCISILVSSGPDLAAAISGQVADIIILTQDVVIQDEHWNRFSTPVLLRHDLFITSTGSANQSDSWPTLDFNLVSAKVRLGNNVTWTLSHLVIKNFRWFSHNVAPGFDIIAPCMPGDRALLVVDRVLLILRACYPAELAQKTIRNLTRPSSLPGKQIIIAPIPQPNCINVTSAAGARAAVPPARQCWLLRGSNPDVGMHGADMSADLKGIAPNGYIVHVLDAEYVCNNMLSLACIEALGPVGCWSVWVTGRVPPAAPPQLLTAAADTTGQESGSSGSPNGRKLGIILGCVLGGALLVTVVAVVVMFLVKRRGEWRPAGRRAKDSAHAKGCPGGGHIASISDAPTNPSCGCGAVSDMAINMISSAMVADAARVLEAAGSSILVALGPREGPKGESVDVPAREDSAICLDREPSQQAPIRHPAAACAGEGGVVVSSLTPQRSDVKFGVEMDNEVTLLSRVLGKGAFGKVVEGEYQGQRVAVKVLLEGTLDAWGLTLNEVARYVSLESGVRHGLGSFVSSSYGTDGGTHEGGQQGTQSKCGQSRPTKLLQCLAQEVEILARCQHPNVVRLLAACVTGPRVCLVMELMDMSLEHLLYGKPGELLPLNTLLDIATDVARGLEYLHPTIVHRDLKPANVLLMQPKAGGSRMFAKLSDFGLSRLYHTEVWTETAGAGTPEFMAPELFDIRNTVVTHKADIYSFSVLIWSMLSGLRPWKGESAMAVAIKVSFRGGRLPLDAIPHHRRPNKLLRLIEECWDHVPARRPAAAEIVKRLIVLQEQLLHAGDQGSDGARSVEHQVPVLGR